MSADAWAAAVVGIAAGVLLAWPLMRTRRQADDESATLVPHRTRELMGALQSGAIVVRRDRRAAFSNAAATALGLARPDGFLHEAVADVGEAAWKADAPVEREVAIRRGVLGSVSTVHVRATPLGEELAFVLANDRTGERAAELTRREFAVNVSHELKTPVGALSLLAETIEEAADEPDTVREFAGKIRKESRRLTKLIQEIIEISRLQGGESVTDHEPVALAEVVDEAVDGARTAADARGIVVTTTAPDAPVTVMGDRDLLVMALRNLVDNAVAYSDEGSKVSVRATVDGSVATVAVIDRGIGIAEHEQERIFERFFRTDPARSRETGGTGLGLSIVKHVAIQHGGDVSVWSKQGVGSTFSLRLPVQPTEEVT